MNSKLKLDEKSISRIHTVIDFEKEIKIREKAFEIEKRVKDILPVPVYISPVADEEHEETIRVVFPGSNFRCLISQIRFSYILDIEHEKGKNIETVFSEINANTKRIFSAIKEVTGKNIKRMGIICNLNVPLNEEESAIRYLLNTFFKFQVNLTGLGFQLAQQFDEKFNINIFVRAQKTETEPAKDIVYVVVDINDYLDQIKRNVNFYEIDEIDRIFNFEKQFVQEKLNNILENKFSLES
jgi:hypothetical protein